MPKLKLISLHCTKTEDDFGADEPYIKVNGLTVWGPGSLNDGQTADLTVDCPPFDAQLGQAVELWEQDNPPFDPDDFLGSFVLTAPPAGVNTQTHHYTGDESDYTLTYEIVPDPVPLVAFPYTTPEVSDKTGDATSHTTAYVKAIVSSTPPGGTVQLFVHIKKAGVFGTGTAYGSVLLVDGTGNRLWQSDVFHVSCGADALSGLNEDDLTPAPLRPFPATTMQSVKNAAIFAKAVNNNGFPQDIDDLIATMKKVEDLLKTGAAIAEAGVEIAALFA